MMYDGWPGEGYGSEDNSGTAFLQPQKEAERTGPLSSFYAEIGCEYQKKQEDSD